MVGFGGLLVPRTEEGGESPVAHRDGEDPAAAASSAASGVGPTRPTCWKSQASSESHGPLRGIAGASAPAPLSENQLEVLARAAETRAPAAVEGGGAADESTAAVNGGMVTLVLRAASRVARTLADYIKMRHTAGQSDVGLHSLAARVAILATSAARTELVRCGCGRVEPEEAGSPLQHIIARALTLACAELAGGPAPSPFKSKAGCRDFFGLVWRRLNVRSGGSPRGRSRSPPTTLATASPQREVAPGEAAALPTS
mmetsp:Transcript_5498/g.14089  ORF Transcript_5498/g.14089 Transcript_5498/m.14089 type:complete len:257 (-) Transcript_5498:13-783(-)